MQMRRASLLLSCLCAVLVSPYSRFLAPVAAGLSGTDSHARSDALNRFFGSIDKDGNGQIEAKEASQYIDANFDEQDITVNPTKAAQQMSSKLDGSDPDVTISKEEVERHLKKLLRVSLQQEFNLHKQLIVASARG